jgi:ribosomal protein S6
MTRAGPHRSLQDDATTKRPGPVDIGRPFWEETVLKTYEGMFLVDAGNPNFDEAVEPVRHVLQRNGAELRQVKKWDERRLAYEIKGRRRGLYVLTYFDTDPASISQIENDVKLNEQIVRALILSGENLSEETMAQATPAEQSQAEEAEKAEKAEAEAKAEQKGEGETEAKPEAEVKPEAEAKAEPAAEAESKPEAETKPTPAGSSEAQPAAEAPSEPAGGEAAESDAEQTEQQ